MKHIERQTKDAEMRETVSKAGNFLLYSTTGRLTYEPKYITHLTPVVDYSMLVSGIPISPVPYPVRTVDFSQVEPYSLESTVEFGLFGNLAFGNFGTVAMPTYKYTDNLLSDTMGASMMAALNSDMQGAYAYLRVTQMLLSMVTPQEQDYPQNQTVGSMKLNLFKL